MASIKGLDFESLPNEILTNILNLFATRDLLPFIPISRRIHSLILRIIHTRLLAAICLPDHQLILECYRPANKISTPYFLCDYLGTDEVDLDTESTSSGVGKLGRMREMFSHFKPVQPEGTRKVWRIHPAGGWLPATLDDLQLGDRDFVSQDIDLESHELFSQLQSQVNLVKVGPRRGLFLSIVEIEEGLTRVWRDWLAERAKNLVPFYSEKKESEDEKRKRLLWSTTQQHTGLRLRVLERDDIPPPILLTRHEDPNIGYRLEYEEVVVRTSHLLLKYEQALEQEVGHSGKALVIVS